MFEESVDLILDDMGRVSKPNVTEKTLTLMSDPLDEDRLLTLLYSMIRDSIRMCTNDEYIGTNNILLFFFGGGILWEEINSSKCEVH